MIQFIKNGKFRTLSIYIDRLINDVITPGDGFPISESLLQAFDSYPQLSEEFVSYMPDSEFNKRVEAFKSFLVNKYSFLSLSDFSGTAAGIDETLCVPEVIENEGDVQITEDTNFILYFDNTGSMTNTSDKLDTMRRTILKDQLMKFYKNDQSLYDSKVKLLNFTDEKGFRAANHKGLTINGDTLVILIQNEATPYHHVPFRPETKKSDFVEDLAILKARMDNTNQDWRVISLHVTGNSGWINSTNAYKDFMKAVENGDNGYEDEQYNLTNYPQVKFVYDLDEGATPEYYLDVILTQMRQLGYAI